MNQHRIIRTLAYSLFLLWLLSLQACSCNWHIKKIKSKCGFTQDTVYQTITVETEKVEKDTVFHYFQKDTVIIREGKLTVKYHYNNKDSTVYVTGKCDPEIIERRVPVTVNKYTGIPWWVWLIVITESVLCLSLYVLYRIKEVRPPTNKPV